MGITWEWLEGVRQQPQGDRVQGQDAPITEREEGMEEARKEGNR